ncbi:MAG: choline-sulfatase, partial [Pseudomonadota bacterium]
MQNLLIVMADQLTALALGCYHNPDVKTPNIDRLASEGVIFDSAYSSSPLCTPARYAFMTGQNISACGGYDNAAYMPATMPTFAHYLRLMGYHTCLSGKMHFVGPDQLHGFEDRVTTDIYPADFGWVPDWTNADERIDLWYHNMSSVKQAGVAAITNQLAYDDEVGAQAMRVIYDHARSEDDRPMCLVASFIHPHDPYATRQKYWDLYEGIDLTPPTVSRPASQDPHNARLEKVINLDAVEVSDQEILNARRAYYGNVSYVDEWVGRLRATLDECGMGDNTTILFTSDHGDMLGEYGLWYKMSMREWSNRIPMIVHNPGRFDPRRVAAPVAQVDVLPTLVDLAAEATGNNKPAPIDPLSGRSLVPLCDGDDSNDPNACVSEYLAEGTAAPILMIRRGKYKYICCETDPEQLFDLEADPNELQSLEDAELLAQFRQEAEAHWDAKAVREQVIANQQRRRSVYAALRVG